MKKKVGLPPMLKKMLIAKALSRAGAAPMAAAPMGAPPGMKKGGSAKKMNMGGMYAKGGSFKDRAASTKSAAHPDGIAQRGKTKGTKVTMKNGGKC
jgi:hypothetical protein